MTCTSSDLSCDLGGEAAAIIYSQPGSCKLNGVEPEVYALLEHAGRQPDGASYPPSPPAPVPGTMHLENTMFPCSRSVRKTEMLSCLQRQLSEEDTEADIAAAETLEESYARNRPAFV